MPLAALLPIISQIVAEGGPAFIQLLGLVRANGRDSDVAELDRQIAGDEMAQAALQREIDRIVALKAAGGK